MKKEAEMEQKVKRTTERNWSRRYRFWLTVLLLFVLMLVGLYCISSYRQNKTPKEGTLVDSVKMYERKA